MTGKESPILGGNGGIAFFHDPSKIKTPNGQGVCLLGFTGVQNGSGIVRLAPIWAALPPKSYTLTVNDSSDMQSQSKRAPDQVHTINDVVNNKTPSEQELEVKVSQEFTTRQSVKYGSEVTDSLEGSLEVEVKAKANFGVVEVEGGVKAGVKAGIEQKANTENGVEQEHKMIFERTLKIKVAPGIVVKATMMLKTSEVKDAHWSGVLTAVYMDGSKLVS